MIPEDTFPALTPLGHDQDEGANWWPSFTDVMTVVLLLFILTTVVIIVRNTSLAQELRISLKEREDAAERLRRSRSAEAALREDLIRREEKLRDKEMRIMLLDDEIALLKRSMEAKDSALSEFEKLSAGLREEIATLRNDMHLKEAENQRVRRDLEARIVEITRAYEKKLAGLSEDARRQREAVEASLAELLGRLKKNQAVVLALTAEKQELDLALAKQRQAYSDLENKYIRLIRPARSAEGKIVVSIQYYKKGETYHILFKDVHSDRLERVGLKELHDRLTVLKEKHKADLYVKVVIPESSGLSYNEAWAFTKDILSRYDYYYQE